MPSITLSSGASFTAEIGVSILDAGMAANLSLPYSCKTGRCSTCKCKIIQGETNAMQVETGLSDADKAEGWVLSCIRTATTDLVLEMEDLGSVVMPKVRTWPCRIDRIEQLAVDVIRVQLRLPPTANFSFIPGQYIDVIGPGGLRRSYSLASAGYTDKQLEVHIRAIDGGAMSQYWFRNAKVNDLLHIKGPLGTFFFRDIADIDLIFLATGTGIAPVKAMLESLPHLQKEQYPKSVTVLWGGRMPQDFYIEVADILGGHHYIPVLSRPDKQWTGAQGYVQDVLLDLSPDFKNAAVYACGSDAMIRSAKKSLMDAGLPSKRFYSDAFVCSATI